MNVKSKFGSIQQKTKSTKRNEHTKAVKQLKIGRQLSIFFTHHGQVIA